MIRSSPSGFIVYVILVYVSLLYVPIPYVGMYVAHVRLTLRALTYGVNDPANTSMKTT